MDDEGKTGCNGPAGCVGSTGNAYGGFVTFPAGDALLSVGPAPNEVELTTTCDGLRLLVITEYHETRMNVSCFCDNTPAIL